MPGFETVDSLQIDAPARVLFDLVLDYPRMHEWFPPCHVEVIGGGPVAVGTRLRHEVAPKGSPVKTRFTRRIDRIVENSAIHETYDGGDLLGSGRWDFVSPTPTETLVSFHCKVRSNRLLMHVGFLVAGERGHKAVYRQLLAALRDRSRAATS